MTRAVPLDPRRNAAWLKLDLYCRGLRLPESCSATDDGGRPVLRTRAGLGSGLELILPGGLYTNVPVLERFAQDSPYELRRRTDSGYELWLDDAPCAPVTLASCPRWYEARTTSGKPMRLVGTLQGTYLAIYPGRTCDFWLVGAGRQKKENCHFCSVGLNLGADDADGKSVDEVLEVVHAAWRESGITYVDFNAGHADRDDALDMLELYVRRVKQETGLLVGVQAPPHADIRRYERLRKLGVNRVSFCFEIFDEAIFAATCPGKARTYGLKRYLDTIEGCASLAKPGRLALEPWVVNGEIIAGLEPPESSVAAIEWLTAHGAIPTACVFRPLRGTDMKDAAPPRAADVLPVFQALYSRCMDAGLPIGIAPNVHVSLVMLPEECRLLVQDEDALRRHARQERALGVKRAAFRALFHGRKALLGPRPRAASARA
jgi:hypothetical protein